MALIPIRSSSDISRPTTGDGERSRLSQKKEKVILACWELRYLESGRLTLTKELKSLFTTQLDTTRDDIYTLYEAILPLHGNLAISYLRSLMP